MFFMITTVVSQYDCSCNSFCMPKTSHKKLVIGENCSHQKNGMEANNKAHTVAVAWTHLGRTAADKAKYVFSPRMCRGLVFLCQCFFSAAVNYRRSSTRWIVVRLPEAMTQHKLIVSCDQYQIINRATNVSHVKLIIIHISFN